MALFGKNEKKVKKAKNPTSPRLRRARTAKLSAGQAHEIIQAPWFSEKALIGTDKGVYVFAIPRTASKAHVAAAIKELYKVSPKKIRIANLPGQRSSKRNRPGHAVRARRRKAYVYLAAGDKIQFA